MKWEMVKLGECVKNLDSKRKPLNGSERRKISQKGLYPYIGANNIMGYVDEFLFDEEIICLAEDGGSWGTNERCANYYHEKCWVNNHAHVLGFNGKGNLKYLMHYLNFADLNKVITGTTRGKLTKSALESLLIPLPPLATQRRIADILDKADALRQKDQALLRKYDELAQAVFVDMFGDPVRNEKGWEVRRLGEVCDKINDGTHFSPPNKPAGVPYITAKHLRKNIINFYANPTYISEGDHREIYSRCMPVKGDVLYIKDGATTGIAAVNEYDFEFSMLSSLALIKPNKRLLNSYFLSSWLNNEYVKENYIKNYMAGAAIRRFTLDKIKRFEVLVPSIELQNKYEAIFKNISKLTENIKNNHSESLFQSLLQKAFTRALVE